MLGGSLAEDRESLMLHYTQASMLCLVSLSFLTPLSIPVDVTRVWAVRRVMRVVGATPWLYAWIEQ